MMTPEERYGRDAQFRMLVDLLHVQIMDCNYTPTELREAVILAATHYEERSAQPMYRCDGDGVFRRSDGYHGKAARQAGT